MSDFENHDPIYTEEDRSRIKEVLLKQSDEEIKHSLKEIKHLVLVDIRDANHMFFRDNIGTQFANLLNVVKENKEANTLFENCRDTFGEGKVYEATESWRNNKSVYIAALQAALLAVSKKSGINLWTFTVDGVFWPNTLLAANKVVKTLLPNYGDFDGVFTAEIVEAMLNTVNSTKKVEEEIQIPSELEHFDKTVREVKAREDPAPGSREEYITNTLLFNSAWVGIAAVEKDPNCGTSMKEWKLVDNTASLPSIFLLQHGTDRYSFDQFDKEWNVLPHDKTWYYPVKIEDGKIVLQNNKPVLLVNEE